MNWKKLAAGMGFCVLAAAGLSENQIYNAVGVRSTLEATADSAKITLDMRFQRFDDPGLERCVAAALSRGAKVRLILSSNEKPSWMASKRLARLGIQLRWSEKNGTHFMVADAKRVILGSFDAFAESLDLSLESVGQFSDKAMAADFTREFQHEWRGLDDTLPRKQTLSDELEALPDPRESEPKIRMKRRNP